MKLLYGAVLGVCLTFATTTVFGQPREYHPRLVRAIEALREATAYMEEPPHDFGGHKREAIRACEEAIRQLELAPGLSSASDNALAATLPEVARLTGKARHNGRLAASLSIEEVTTSCGRYIERTVGATIERNQRPFGGSGDACRARWM